MRHHVLALLCAALLAAGCSKPAPQAPAAPATPPPANAAVQPQQPAVATAAPTPAKSPEVDNLNDQAITLVREHFPAEGAEAARKATLLDESSSAAWFNLGRAYSDMGKFDDARKAFDRASALTGGKNADVEYYRGRADLLAGKYDVAISFFEEATKRFPTDKEIAQALSDARSLKGSATVDDLKITLTADVDGDGKQDMIAAQDKHLRITAATGKALFDADLPGRIHRFHLYPIEGTTPLIHAEYEGCPSAPLNYFIQWDAKAGKALTEDVSPCLTYTHKGNGRLTEGLRAIPFYLTIDVTWQNGAFVPGQSNRYVVWGMVRYENLAAALTEVAGDGLSNPSELFATADLYRQFRQKTGTKAWKFEQTPWKDQSGTIVRAFQDGKQNGGWEVALTDGLITRLKWREEGTIASFP